MRVKPLIPWMGGKRRLVKDILPLFPEHECYVEPFFGGGAMYFAKEESKVEVINDINCELVNLYRVVQNHLEPFVDCFKYAVSRKVFEWEKMKNPETLTDIQRAARFFYLQRSCYGGKITSQTFGTATTDKPKLNLLRVEEDLSEAYLRLQQSFIECLPWDEVVKKYDRAHTLFYFDPPYLDVAGYGVEFGIEEYQHMAELMQTMSGKAILSINAHPTIRDIFQSFEMSEVNIKYTVGGGKKAKQAKELIIRNF